MKRIFTLLLLILSAFTFKAVAQTTTCNAEFTWQFVNGNTVKFTPAVNDSPLVHHEWNFGDGTANSQVVSPTHSYVANGTYIVTHTVVRFTPNGAPLCTASITHTIIIQQAPPPCNLVADFSWNTTTVNPLTIGFHNLSTPSSPSDSVRWIFGDGATLNGLQSNPAVANPVHSYANAGTYTVCLIVKKNEPGSNQCIRYICKTVVVPTPNTCNLIADFNWTIAANNPLTFEFHNTSTPSDPTDSVRWNFGDGTVINGVQGNPAIANPVHPYLQPGTYNVCIRVKKNNTAGGSNCVRELCKTIVIPPPCTLVVDFSWNTTAANPLAIEFHNLSTPSAPSDSVRWSFGDGVTLNGLQSNPAVANPLHTYANAGTYTVCLIVRKNDNPPGTNPCIRYICKTVIVQSTTACTLIADFNWTVSTSNPLSFQFHNTSTPSAPTDSVRWNFGDGTVINGVQGDPTIANPVHTYLQPGTYNVCIRVKKNNTVGGSNCVRELCKTIVIPPPCTLVVDYSWNATAANPLAIEFHNLSTPSAPSDSVRWSFGDGTTLNGLQSNPAVANPLHTYANAGTYSVCLIVRKNDNPPGTNPCIRYICKTIIVQAPCNLVAYFSWNATTANPLAIEFHNLSTPSDPTDSVRWTFGDGTSLNGVQGDPAVANPLHTYLQPGTYNVCIRVKKNNNTGSSTCVREFCKTVVVTAPCNFQVNFSWLLDQVNPRIVHFTNLTVAPTASATATWTFGDGTSANTWNAVHEYAQPGRYYVCLKVEAGPNCIRYKCDSITVPVPMPPCNNQSNFSVLSTSTNSQTFTFVPAFQNSAAVYTWTFGDGTGSHDMIATHHYALPGTYNACLTVWRSATCVSTTCKEVHATPQLNCDTVHVTYSYQPDPNVPNKIHFYANSNVPILDQTWTIVKLPVSSGSQTVTLHQNNPTYLFPDTGSYRVCLRAITLGGCIKEYCSIIHITQVSNACLLQAYPNPASNVVNVNVTLTQPGMIDAYVYNSLNVLVREKHQPGVTGNNVVTIELNNLPAGMYTMKLIYANHVCYAPFQKL